MINYTTIYANYTATLTNIYYNLFNNTEILLLKHESYINNITDSTIIVIKSVQCKREILFTILYVISVYINCITILYALELVNITIYNLFKYIKSYIIPNMFESVDENSIDNSVNGVNNYYTENTVCTDFKNDLFIKINTNKTNDLNSNRCVMKIRRSIRNKKKD